MKYDNAFSNDQTTEESSYDLFNNILENDFLLRPLRNATSYQYSLKTTAVFAQSGPDSIFHRTVGETHSPASLCGLHLFWLGAPQPSFDNIFLENPGPGLKVDPKACYIRLLEALEFRRFSLLVVPNLAFILKFCPDPYKFLRFCLQSEVELHTAGCGRVTEADLAPFHFVGREELAAPWSTSPIPLPRPDDMFRLTREDRPSTDAAQLARLLGGRFRDPTGTILSCHSDKQEELLVLWGAGRDSYAIDSHQLEIWLPGIIIDVLDANEDDGYPSAGPSPSSEPYDGTSTMRLPRLTRYRLRSALHSGKGEIFDPCEGFGRLTWEDCVTVRRTIASIDLVADGPRKYRLELHFAAELALPSCEIPGVLARWFAPSGNPLLVPDDEDGELPIEPDTDGVPPLPPLRRRRGYF